MDNLLIRFFLPTLDGSIHAVLQLTFAVIFVAAVVVTPMLVKRAARSEQWERRLAALDDVSGPVPAYATIDEMSAAVATPAERWADVLPSLLLVFGLLGTFIGLGLALTEAAGVLGPDSDALSGLTPIMDSLGSKFKTSTWGILAFLGLKLWSMARPYEEQRLAWAARQIKRRAAHAVELASRQQADERQQLIDAITRSNGALLAAQEQAARVQQSAAGEQLARLEQIAACLGSAAGRQLEHAEAQSQRMAELAEHTAANRAAMENFVGSVSANIATMASAADGMAVAAGAAGKASADLGTAIGEFRNTMVTVLGDVKSGLGETIDGMRDTFATNMHAMANDLARATNGIEGAISTLSTGVAGTIEMLEKANQESVKRQTIAQATFAASGEQLMASMGEMQSFVEHMQQKTEAGLKSVAGAGQQMLKFDQRFADTNTQIEALVGDIRRLAGGIEQHRTAQLETEARYQRQLAESEQLVSHAVSLSAAITTLVDAQQDARRQESGERMLATLERIEAALGGIGQGRNRATPAADVATA